MIKFNWRRGTKKIAKVRLEFELDAHLLQGILIYHYSTDHDADELPDDLTRKQVEDAIRNVLKRGGMGGFECSFYDDVPAGEDEAFDAWALTAVRRCFPELAGELAG